MAVTNEPKTMSIGFNDTNILHSVDILKDNEMYSDINPHLLNWIQNHSVMHYYHDFGIKVEDFEIDKRLTNIF
jgi:hypothetical protein